MLFYILIILLVLSFGVYFLLKFLRNVQPSEAEVDQDLKELKEKVKAFKGGFMPWTDEISSNQIDQILTKDNARSGNGVFLSSLGDPIFAYAYKNYIGPGQNAVMYILTQEHEYVFRITNKGTEVFMDNERKGLIRENGIFYDLKNDEVAQLKRHGASGINKIYIGEEEVAKIALPDSIAAKAIDVTKIDLSPLEKNTVQMMAVYDLVSNIEETEG
ncbi:hypothetical protein [Aureispira sp. CCB-QB1]|uniref:hypothetical protein n=1 Tax=Aureispira sp. CCB-QB1 TaxID=1313421 RepID=UPI000698D6C2|nr:hypothetical protein [Aureispira sp. CCB-QB1]